MTAIKNDLVNLVNVIFGDADPEEEADTLRRAENDEALAGLLSIFGATLEEGSGASNVVETNFKSQSSAAGFWQRQLVGKVLAIAASVFVLIGMSWWLYLATTTASPTQNQLSLLIKPVQTLGGVGEAEINVLLQQKRDRVLPSMAGTDIRFKLEVTEGPVFFALVRVRDGQVDVFPRLDNAPQAPEFVYQSSIFTVGKKREIWWALTSETEFAPRLRELEEQFVSVSSGELARLHLQRGLREAGVKVDSLEGLAIEAMKQKGDTK